MRKSVCEKEGGEREREGGREREGEGERERERERERKRERERERERESLMTIIWLPRSNQVTLLKHQTTYHSGPPSHYE